MKPVQILVLVVAGALGGAVVTKVWQRPKAAVVTPVAAQVRETPAEALPHYVAPTAAPQTAPTPVEVEKPSPVAPRREAPKTKTAIQPVKTPPPANPRPVIRTARLEPPPANPRPVITASPVEPAPVAPPVVEAPPADFTPPARPEPEHVTPAPPPPPPPNQVTLNAGVLIPVRLVDGLNSERNLGGDTFSATLDKELVVDGFVIAERGARVDGRVVNVDRGGKVSGVASMAVELTRLRTSDGQTIPIHTETFERRAEASHQNDAAKVGGAAAVGAIIGAIAGGGKGAAIGAGVGGGAGAGNVMLTRGKPVTFPSETRISFRLSASVTITERK